MPAPSIVLAGESASRYGVRSERLSVTMNLTRPIENAW